MAVGKNFLENLTVAMYENSFTVYREFVQNAADSIDKAIASGLADPEEFYIDISIEYSKRKICVYDNACGIPMHLFKKKMLDVADSDKDRDTEKGFRGIGRLAGLGYCDKLIFRTTARGEDKEAIITWDGVKLKEIVDDPMQHPSSEELIDTITEIEYQPADMEDHFFEVIMEDVIFESDDLLDEEQVIKYLQAVSPVPYANYFIFSSKIQDFANENNFKIDEYTISVNGNQLFKPYKTILYEGTSDNSKPYDEIKDVAFEIFKGADGKPIAWMWYGIAKYEKQIQAVYREEDKLKELKPEDRLKQRQVVIKPLIDALFAYLKSNERKASTAKLKQAVTYALNQEKYLRVFLEDGEVPMDNNASERAIRGFCIGKKNWEMIDTINGAASSAIIYSIAETAKANNLKPYEYFEYLLPQIPEHMDDTDRSFLEDLLPWSPKLPEYIRKQKDC